jgi:hypothetical protein
MEGGCQEADQRERRRFVPASEMLRSSSSVQPETIAQTDAATDGDQGPVILACRPTGT